MTERFFVAIMAGMLAACQALPPSLALPQGVSRAFSSADLAGQSLDLEWHLPMAEPRAWVLVQHGFARHCANLRGTAAALAARGVATVCINADMAQGAPVLARAFAAWWRTGSARAPDGRPAPRHAVLAGHSAGGLFAAQVAAELRRLDATVVAGVLLFDPVGGAPLRAALLALSDVPVAASLAGPAPCNAMGLARPALEAIRVPWIEPARSTHLDAEGEDTESVAVRACREGPPQAETVQALRRWAGDALDTMLR